MPRTNLLLPALLLAAACTGRPTRGDTSPTCALAEGMGGAELPDALQECCGLNRDDRLDVLVLSGGGSHGAWGVGVLGGWREAATGPKRPDFKIVTGVSTGALMAPFYFVNDPAAEEVAREIYTTVSDRDIRRKRFIAFVPFSSSFYLQAPLWKLITKHYPNVFIDSIARHGDRGRRLLLVGTVNLDSGHSKVWNLTSIAASKSPDRYDCFRKVIFASASMPVVAEPVFLDGAMHVDGGAREQLFVRNVLNPVFHEADARQQSATKTRARPSVYVIVNGQIDVVHEQETIHNVLPILARTIEVLIAENKAGNLLRVATTARQMGADLFVSSIPPEEDLFDSYTFTSANMQQLVEKGRAWGQRNNWSETLPRLAEAQGLAAEKALGQ